MTALAKAKAPGLFEASLEWLDDQAPLAGAPWLLRLRQQAEARWRDGGLPGPKDEAFRFTPLREVAAVPFVPATGAGDPAAVLAARPDTGDLVVPVVDGIPRLPAGGADGVTVRGLAEVLATAPHEIEAHLGHLTRPAPFTDLNTARFTDGVVVVAARGAAPSRAVHLVHVATGGAAPAASHPRVLVVAEAGSRLRLVESFHGPGGETYLVNPVAEVHVGAGAVVDHLRLEVEGGGAFHLGTCAVRCEAGGHYHSRVFAFGGRLARLDLDVALAGEGAETTLDGLYVSGGAQLLDHHTFVDHLSPGATSHEVYKGILDGKSTAVFDGTIVVRPDAQKTSGAQENRNLLLSRDAQVHTKPHLAIDADDVKCSHGATVGQLDEDPLFYLRSRGIDEATARGILVFGFARAIVDGVPDAAWRRHLGEALIARLPDGARLRELV